MLRTLAAAALAIAWAGSAGAVEAPDQIKNCQQGNAGISSAMAATEKFLAEFKKIRGGGPDNPDFSIMFDGPRLVAVNEFFQSYKAFGPSLDDFAKRLETLREVIGACAAGDLKP